MSECSSELAVKNGRDFLENNSLSAFQFIVISKCDKRKQFISNQCSKTCKEALIHYIHLDDSPGYVPAEASTEIKEVVYRARSHYRALEYASRDTSCEFSVIIEDNVSIHKTDFLRVVTTLIKDWELFMGSDKMASIGWMPCQNYDMYTSAKSCAKMDLLPEFKLMNHIYVFGTQAYIVRKKDLAPYISVLIQPTYLETEEAIRKQKYSFEKDCKLSAQDVVLPRILGQRSLFPPVAIELQTSSLTGSSQQMNMDRYFKNHEKLRDSYYSLTDLGYSSSIISSDNSILKNSVILSPETPFTSKSLDSLDTPLVITFDNEPDNEGTKYFCKTLEKNGWEFKIIGIGLKWESWRTRMKSYYEELEKHHPMKIIVLSDARDVFCIRKSNSFIKGFKTFNKPIVTSMEIFCSGYDEYNEKRIGNCMTLASYWVHNKMTPPLRKFVNNGLVTGYAGELKHVYKWMFDKGFDDDQFGLGMYVINFPDKIATDSDAKLLHTSNFGVNAGVQYIHKQAVDAPTLAELNGNSAYFLHVSGQKNKGQKIIYNQVKMILDSGLVGPGILTSAYGWKEPEFDEVFVCA